MNNIQEKYTKHITDQNKHSWFNKALTRHLKKHAENQTDIEHVIDYLNSEDCPKKLFKMSFDAVLINADKWTKIQQKKGMHILETETDTETVYRFKDGMKLVRLVGEAAFKREGFLMSHCVASYYGKSEVDVYSLRDYKEMPHCTLEVTSGEVHQIKGKGNGSIHPKYVKYVIQLLEKHFKMPVRDNEMNNLGYDLLTDDILEFLDRYCEGHKFITFNGKKYLYRYSSINVKERSAELLKKELS